MYWFPPKPTIPSISRVIQVCGFCLSLLVFHSQSTMGKNRAAVVDNISWQALHVVLVKVWVFFFFAPRGYSQWVGKGDFVQPEKMKEAVSLRSLTSICPTLHCLNHGLTSWVKEGAFVFQSFSNSQPPGQRRDMTWLRSTRTLQQHKLWGTVLYWQK